MVNIIRSEQPIIRAYRRPSLEKFLNESGKTERQFERTVIGRLRDFMGERQRKVAGCLMDAEKGAMQVVIAKKGRNLRYDFGLEEDIAEESLELAERGWGHVHMTHRTGNPTEEEMRFACKQLLGAMFEPERLTRKQLAELRTALGGVTSPS